MIKLVAELGFIMFTLCAQSYDGAWHPGPLAIWLRPSIVIALANVDDDPGGACTRVSVGNGRAFTVVGTADEVVEKLTDAGFEVRREDHDR